MLMEAGMKKRTALIATACALILIGFAAGVLFSGALAAGAEGVGGASEASGELVARVEALEARMAAAGPALQQGSDRELARIADNLHDASDRWLRDIAGSLAQISSELVNIKRAIEAK
jgi:hypothetical protein